MCAVPGARVLGVLLGHSCPSLRSHLCLQRVISEMMVLKHKSRGEMWW